MLVVVGCDPGGRHTGLVSRANGRVLAFSVLESLHPPRGIPSIAYALDVVTWIEAEIERARSAGHDTLCAVEGLVEPSGFRHGKKTPVHDPSGLMGTAIVFSAVSVRIPGVVEVRPGGNGSAPLSQYPKELVGPRERAGGGILGHARSAWDVAGAGPRAARFPMLR